MDDTLKSLVNSLIDYYHDQQQGVAIENQEFYGIVAGKLSQAIHLEKPWGWRYVQSVYRGTLEPSKDFVRSVKVLGATLDGTPAELADLERVQVHAPHGLLRPGALVWTPAVLCAAPDCSIWFVPNTPRRKKCFRCSPVKGR